MVGPFTSRFDGIQVLFRHQFDPVILLKVEPERHHFWLRVKDGAIAVFENNPSGMPASTRIISPIEWEIED